MNTNTCYRCKMPYDSDSLQCVVDAELIKHNRSYIVTKVCTPHILHIDLCPNCKTKLFNWIENGGGD